MVVNDSKNNKPIKSSNNQRKKSANDNNNRMLSNTQPRRTTESKKSGTDLNTAKSNTNTFPMTNNVINNKSSSSLNPNTVNNSPITTTTIGGLTPDPAIMQNSNIIINSNNNRQIQNEELSVLTGYYACARYFLFLIYLIILISLILNIFLHFIFYGSNMSIASIFIDVHHRQELISGEYYSLESYLSNNFIGRADHQFVKHPMDSLHCDRNSFLSLLDEFYHQYPLQKSSSPSTTYDNRNESPKPYPKIFNDFNNYARSKTVDNDDVNNDDDMYFSSSSTLNHQPGELVKKRIGTNNNNNDASNKQENRLLIIEVIALILLFIIVLNQVLGLIGVIKKHLILLTFVTIVDSLLFSILMLISNIGIIILLLMASSVGYLFIFQLKIGLRKRIKERLRLKEDIAAEVQDAIVQMRNRMSPCIHVSMEQYEAMTQQMLNRYSSPIVYCPHYNESLC